MSSLPITTVTAAIKTVFEGAIATLTVLDVHEMQEALTRGLPVLFPEPRDGFFTGLSTAPDAFGGESRPVSLVYQLRYTLAYKAVGEGRGLADILPECYDTAKDIVDAAITNNTLDNVVDDFAVVQVLGNGMVSDPAGNGFYGFTFLFQVEEYL